MFFDCCCEEAPVAVSYEFEGRELDGPTNRSKAAGLRSSKELSSFSGVRHFWQYILELLM
jgi:hypothetical protein